MTVRHARPQALATERSSVPPGHVRGGPGLVDKDQARGVEIELLVEPLLTSPQDVRPLLLGRVRGLFLRVIRPPGKEAPQAAVATATPRAASAVRSSSRVRSGVA